MSMTLRKGWCPGALRPMEAEDGLVVRLRLTGGILPAATAHALADHAERYGNGRFDLTSRANLQMRGVGEGALPALLDDLRMLGLVDADAAAEAVRNVIASPLAGLHDGLDIRPLVAALEGRLAGAQALHALPPKFLFLVDDGAQPSLAGIAADVRFDWRPQECVFAIDLGGTRADAIPAGTCAAHDLVDCAEVIARGAIEGFARVPEARRMKTLVAALGANEVLRLCGARPGRSGVAASSPVKRAQPPLPASRLGIPGWLRPFHGGCAQHESRIAGRAPALSTPYGRLDAGMLHVAAELAAAGLGELRVTPWRSLLLPGVDSARMPERVKKAGWIVDDDDPRLAVAACVGAPECGRATTRTRADADALADLAVALGRDRTALHVSGCAKGCAHAAPAPVVLVGREGRYDLVRDGRASDPPIRRGLDLVAARAAIAAFLPL